ncbi:hypothetical protein [Streptomyces sp. SID12501]|uniref:Uncharacterized protein n=1 Tax=Streptomyces sp. SID12501 TaxID=2706042 RepID=A0A6B3BV23_9ACTN|nr:hypothetical protein [Streptomyces sp. SID12501]NEC88234.1 hypothetical protein [Streptomyces sp. SID12501]
MRFSVRIHVQIVLITVVTLATLVSTWQFSQAGGAYQDAVREDVKRQAALQDDARRIYADEAPLAFLVAVAEARADALETIKKGNRLASSEHTLASRTAFRLRHAAPPELLIGNDTYLTEDLGYNVPRRLADVQKLSPELYALSPEATLRDGDDWAFWGLISAGIAGLAVIAAAIAASVLRPVAWRRPTPSGTRILRDPEIIPQPVTTPPARRRAAWFHLVVVALLFLLPLGQIAATGSEQRAQAEAARRAVQLTTSIAASGERSAFLTQSVQAAHVADAQAAVRMEIALDTRDARDTRPELDVAAVETAVASQLRRTAEYMGRVPSHADGVDSATVAALGAQSAKWPAMRIEQNHQVSLAEQAGNRALLLSAATAIGIVAEFLMAAAITARRHRWLYGPLGAAAISIFLAVVSFI